MRLPFVEREMALIKVAGKGETRIESLRLADIFRASVVDSTTAAAPAETALAGPEADRARQALNHYNEAVQQLKSGNWAGFGKELDALKPLLEELSQHSAGR